MLACELTPACWVAVVRRRTSSIRLPLKSLHNVNITWSTEDLDCSEVRSTCQLLLWWLRFIQFRLSSRECGCPVLDVITVSVLRSCYTGSTLGCVLLDATMSIFSTVTGGLCAYRFNFLIYFCVYLKNQSFYFASSVLYTILYHMMHYLHWYFTFTEAVFFVLCIFIKLNCCIYCSVHVC